MLPLMWIRPRVSHSRQCITCMVLTLHSPTPLRTVGQNICMDILTLHYLLPFFLVYIFSQSHLSFQSLPSIGWALYAVCVRLFIHELSFLQIVLLSGCLDRSCAIHSSIRIINCLLPTNYLHQVQNTSNISCLPMICILVVGVCIYIPSIDELTLNL